MAFTLFYFLLALFLLVTVHEYGHFIVARCCGVKVIRFSFGFGKVLARWRDKKGTEYVWSLIPLGGYVKMLDSEEENLPLEKQHLAFNHQSPWRRVAIIVAGPLFNFLFAWFALSLVLMMGVRSLAPIIDTVQPGSLGADIGLTNRQEIIRVNDKTIKDWQDFQFALMPLIGSESLATVSVKSIETGEKKTYSLPLTQWQVDAKHPNILDSLGIVPFIPKLAPIIGEVVAGSPAEQGGLEKGDRIFAVNGKKFVDWFALVKYVKANPHKDLSLTYVRGDIPFTTTFKIGLHSDSKRPEGFIGLRSQAGDWPKEWLRTKKLSPVGASKQAVMQTVEMIKLTFQMMGHLITGRVGLENLSGPVGIAHEAGESARGGLTYYLSFLALVSVSLGVLNLLPIPLLDGGQLFYCFWEILSRRPVAPRVKWVSTYLGLIFLISLMVLALSNDLVRLIR